MNAADRARDSYGSWSVAIRAWREIRVRSGEYEPVNEIEQRWRAEGPRLPMRLDSVLSPSADTGGQAMAVHDPIELAIDMMKAREAELTALQDRAKACLDEVRQLRMKMESIESRSKMVAPKPDTGG